MGTRSTRNSVNHRPGGVRSRAGGKSNRYRSASSGTSGTPASQRGNSAERAGTPASRRKESVQRSGIHVSQQKKKNLKRLGIVLAVILVIFLAGGILKMINSPSQSESRIVIKRFQEACNNLDVAEMVNCMEPSMTNNLVKLGTVIVGDDALNSVLKILGSGIDAFGLGDEADIETLFQTIQLEPKEYGFPKKKRCIKCKADFAGMTQFINVYITKYYGDVYITKLELI